MLKKINLNISGIHCRSCKNLIETEVDILPGVKNITVDHKTGKTEVEFDETKVDKEKIEAEIKKLGYTIYAKEEDKNQLLKWLLPSAAIAFLILGYILTSIFGGMELLARLNEGNVGYGIILTIGLLAGFHCIGMCGGLVVTYCAANIQKEKEKKNIFPHFQYNLGRIISYTIIGGILGGIGSFFGINPHFSGVFLILASFFMISMGLSFFFNWQILEKIKLRTPEFIAKYLYKQKHSQKPKGPLIIGLLTGFMPCGPLQAMQLYALTSGNIIEGALSMAIYGLGTALLLFIFGLTVSTISAANIKKMIKFSGALIIVLGLFMANRGLANFGYGFKTLTNTDKIEYANTTSKKENIQTVNMDLTYSGYSPNVLYIKKDIPVRWVINVKQMSGCTDEIILHGNHNIRKKLQMGENIIEFTPDTLGELKFSCWMKMVWGKFIVTDEKSASTPTAQADTQDLPTSSCNGSCGNSTCAAAQGGTCGCGNK